MAKVKMYITLEIGDGEEPEKYMAYADADDVYEAIGVGFKEIMVAVQEKKPTTGKAFHVSHMSLGEEITDYVESEFGSYETNENKD